MNVEIPTTLNAGLDARMAEDGVVRQHVVLRWGSAEVTAWPLTGAEEDRARWDGKELIEEYVAAKLAALLK